MKVGFLHPVLQIREQSEMVMAQSEELPGLWYRRRQDAVEGDTGKWGVI